MPISQLTAPRFSLVIPCFNEAEAIPSVLSKLHILAQKQAFEIIVVDDGSTDASVSLVQNFKSIRSLQHKRNQGYGSAIKTGVRAARSSYVAIMDLDGTCDPNDFKKLLLFLKNNPDSVFVSGSRLHASTSMPFIRQLGNYMFSLLTSLLFLKSVRDPCSGIRIYNKSWLLHFLDDLPDGLNFSLATTLIMALRKHNFSEVDVTYFERIGDSKLCEMKDGLNFLKTIFFYRLSLKSSRSVVWNNSTDQIA